MDIYWHISLISANDPTLPSISGTYVGYPQEKLQSIYYRLYFGTPTLQEGHEMQQIMDRFDDGYGLHIASEDDCYIPHVHESLNWSTVDVDAPYCLCSICELAVVDNSEVCLYVRAFLDHTDDDNTNTSQNL